jgi:hypothetical protein
MRGLRKSEKVDRPLSGVKSHNTEVAFHEVISTRLKYPGILTVTGCYTSFILNWLTRLTLFFHLKQPFLPLPLLNLFLTSKFPTQLAKLGQAIVIWTCSWEPANQQMPVIPVPLYPFRISAQPSPASSASSASSFYRQLSRFARGFL